MENPDRLHEVTVLFYEFKDKIEPVKEFKEVKNVELVHLITLKLIADIDGALENLIQYRILMEKYK